MELNIIYNEDCLEGMKRIPDGIIDMILCDLPYGTTQCSWDTIIPLEDLWKQYERIIGQNGCIVLTGSQPFTSILIASNLRLFRYELIWEKSKASNFLDANKRPMKCHENICIFYNKLPIYNPQKWRRDELFIDRRKTFNSCADNNTTYGQYGEKKRKVDTGERYPLSILSVASHHGEAQHPTQKPVLLFEYLIKTYTNPGSVVLDNCMGSGTTAIACINTGRNFIGFEKERKYYDQSIDRIEKHKHKLFV